MRIALIIVIATSTLTADPLGDAVEQPALLWTSPSNPPFYLPWTAQTAVKHDGVDAAKTGAIPNNGISTMSVNVTGPAVLRFWWQVSSELDSDFLIVEDNGNELGFISGTVNWTQKVFYLSPGPHQIEWFYTKDGGSFSGSDAGWVDQVEFLPLSQAPPVFASDLKDITIPVGGTLALCPDAVGAQPMTYVWHRNGTVISGATNACYAVLSATSGNAGTYTCTATNALGTAISTAAVVTVASASTTLATAMDNALAWTTFGDAFWASQTTTTHDGVDAAKAGTIGDNEYTSIGTTVFGPGRLSFWYKVSSQANNDFLHIEQNSNLLEKISGTVDWTQKSYYLGPGLHRVELYYSKSPSGLSGSDTAWVDQVAFTQSPYAAWATTNFTLQQRVSEVITALTADPNGDGVNNLLAYATGISPTTGTGTPMPVIALDGANTTLTYTKNTAATDVTFAVQRSQDLAAWTTITTTDTIVSTNGNIRTIRATLPAVASGSWLYRVHVTLSQ